MAFSKAIYKEALEIKQQQRQKALREYEAAIQTAEEASPALQDIKTKLNMCGARLAMTALSGDPEKLATLKSECDKLTAEQEKLLKTNPYPNAPTFKCNICNDTGYANGHLCECTEKLAKDICFKELSAKMPIENCRFDNFDLSFYPDDGTGKTSPAAVAEKTLSICKNFVNTFPCGKNLLFSGKPGLGKTHLSLAIAGELIDKGYSVIYSPAQNIIDAILKERFSYSDAEDVITAINDCDLLILDDLGTEIATSASASVVYNIINTRILENKSTIISTNLDPDSIEQKYDPRVLSRLIGHYTKRTFFGNDIRQNKNTPEK